MAVSSTGSSTSTVVDQYVEAYTNTQLYRYEPYDIKAEQLNMKQEFFSQLNGKLNTLLSTMDKFGTYKNVTTGEGENATTTRSFVEAKNVDSLFETRKISISQSDFLTATAKGTALTGLNNVKVLQTATTDSYVGKRVDITDGGALSQDLLDKIDAGTGKGSFKFSMKVGAETRDFNIEYSSEDTNETLMKRIVSTVNQKDEAGLGDTLNAAFVKDTTGTARLTFTSKNTGAENAISFSVDDENTATASLFGISDNVDRSTVKYDDTDGESFGYIRSNADDLNSKININGVTVTRGSNSIDDAIDGVTLTLKKAHGASDAATSLNTEVDVDAVKKLIDPLMQAFNGISNFVAVNKEAHGNDASMNGLTSSLRGLTSSSLLPSDPDELAAYKTAANYSNEETQPIKYLAELGFSMSAEGVLSLSDTEKFQKILLGDDGAKLISDAIKGFSSKVSQYMDSLASRDGNQGLIKSRLSSISQQIDTNNKKITQIDESIEKMAEATRKQYTAYLSAYYNAQNQSALLSTFSSSGGGAYDSLVAQSYTSNNGS